MKKIYLVWFRPENETEDKIRGIALNWEKAEKMAENLNFHLKITLKCEYEYGVKSYCIHQMPFDLLNDDGCLDRWGPEDFGE